MYYEIERPQSQGGGKMTTQTAEQKLDLQERLNRLALNLRAMQLEVKVAHWNVKGPNFQSLHLLFDQVAGHLDEAVDRLAERVVTLGGWARGSWREIGEVSDAGDASQPR